MTLGLWTANVGSYRLRVLFLIPSEFIPWGICHPSVVYPAMLAVMSYPHNYVICRRMIEWWREWTVSEREKKVIFDEWHASESLRCDNATTKYWFCKKHMFNQVFSRLLFPWLYMEILILLDTHTHTHTHKHWKISK